MYVMGNSVNDYDNRSLSNANLAGTVPASISDLDQLEQMYVTRIRVKYDS